MQEFHVLNLGAGVQSTTLYLMIASGELPIPLDCAIFADTGEEPAAVYAHLNWLRTHGGPPIWTHSKGRRLGDDLMRGENSTGQRFASIPAFIVGTQPEVEEVLSDQEILALELPPDTWSEDLKEKVGRTRRQCSKEYKVEVIEQTIRRELCGLKPGQRVPKKRMRIVQYVGISLDESGRFTRLQKRRTLGTMRAPLIERHMTRADCLRWLAERGNVPHVVPRSACTFCPFHDDAEWTAIKAVPEDWARAVEIDAAMRLPGAIVNRGMDAEMFVHRSCKPLTEITFSPKAPDTQQSLGFWQADEFSRECLGVCGL